MKWKAMIWVAAVLMLAAGRAQADLTVIDFESLANGVVVDDQFLTLGVDFNSTAKALLSSLTFPASSGDKLIYNWSANVIQADAVGQSWTMVGGYVTGNTNIIMTAYDGGGSELGSASTGGANWVGSGTGLPPNIFLSVSAPNIAYAIFDGGVADSFTVDDFTFNPVPVPGAALLGMLGLSVAGLKLRKRA